MQYYTIIASTYGSGTYDSSSYSGQTSTSTGGGSGTGAGGGLANTGVDVLLGVTIACVLLFAAMIVRLWRRPKRRDETS